MSVRSRYNLFQAEGDLGVEIELECQSRDDFDRLSLSQVLRKDWKITRDGSLRDLGLELVLDGPKSLDETSRAIRVLDDYIEKYKMDLPDTGRAGVHVHVNMQDYSMKEVYNLICLYLIFEESLIQMCGDWRIGNLFCLRARDAEAMIRSLEEIARAESWRNMASDELRYAALNVNSLPRFGSIEFRAMRSTTDPKVLIPWCQILLALRDAAVDYESPEAVVMDFSLLGPEGLYDKVFGRLDVNLELDPDAMVEGMAMAQWLAFCRDWDTIKEPPELVHDRKEFKKFLHELLTVMEDEGNNEENMLYDYVSTQYEEINRLKPNTIQAIFTTISDTVETEEQQEVVDDYAQLLQAKQQQERPRRPVVFHQDIFGEALNRDRLRGRNAFLHPADEELNQIIEELGDGPEVPR